MGQQYALEFDGEKNAGTYGPYDTKEAAHAAANHLAALERRNTTISWTVLTLEEAP